jgi:hypothetical protein
VSLGGTLSTSLLAVLALPSTWPLGLLGFLVRGGWLLVVAPIVVVPTPVGLANVIAPLLEDVAFGRRTAEVAISAGIVAVGALVWLVGGGLIAAGAEAEGVHRIAEEEGVPLLDHPVAWRILGVRLLAQVPLAVAAVWAAVRIVGVAYRELTVPSDVTVPLVWRIVVGAPDAFVIASLAWLFGEVVGAIAARLVVVGGADIRTALRDGLGRARRRPARMGALGLATTAALVVVLGTTGLAAGATWNALGAALTIGDSAPTIILLLFLFVGLFVGGLVLIGVASAWRSAVWTIDVAGTFGGGDGTRSGD